MSITLIIVAFTGLISYQAFNDRNLFNKLAHYPVQEHQTKDYGRLLTAGFVHADWTHLIVNMYVLYLFGEIAESAYVQWFGGTMGRLLYLLLYIVTIVAANIPTFLRHKNNPSFLSVGASGAVSGLVFIYILLYPWNKLLLMFILPIWSIVAGILYLIYSSYAAKKSIGRIDHLAHFYGAIFGILFTVALYPRILEIFWRQLTVNFPFG